MESLKHALLICFAAAAVLVACADRGAELPPGLTWKRELFGRLESNLKKPLVERIQVMPDDLLAGTRAYDQSIGIANPDRYASRAATSAERALFDSYVKLLPPTHRRVLSEKLMAVYILQGFSGAALTDWVLSPAGKFHYYLILNAEIFDTSLDHWLLYKDDSLFQASAGSPTVKVRTATDFKALMYGLLHEGAHMVDYELGITPYMDSEHRELSHRKNVTTPFTRGVWADRLQPNAAFDFKHRTDLNAYGMFSTKGLIPRSKLAEMFSQLAATPFVSFYSGTSWNEDLADCLTYHHIEQVLKGSVTVELSDGEKLVIRRRPTQASLTAERLKALQVFYE